MTTTDADISALKHAIDDDTDLSQPQADRLAAAINQPESEAGKKLKEFLESDDFSATNAAYVCCSLPNGSIGMTHPDVCRKAKGTVVPTSRCRPPSIPSDDPGTSSRDRLDHSKKSSVRRLLEWLGIYLN